uniref:WGS project CAEQ00000000 data, annotated contig 1337 n=1 Tax=Trypanosoma congolense (strain IL3000) TaxID=1068625 RepID=F9W5K7_TRYCI|nr:unnamed protein product [Trypanosoma congolense IL3000]
MSAEFGDVNERDAEIIRTDSKVDSVTIYKGRAQVQRSAQVKLPPLNNSQSTPGTPANTPATSMDAVDQLGGTNTVEASGHVRGGDCEGRRTEGGAKSRMTSLIEGKYDDEREVHIYFAMPASFDRDSVQVGFDELTADRVVLRRVFFETVEGLQADGSGAAEEERCRQRLEEDLSALQRRSQELAEQRELNRLQQEQLDDETRLAMHLFNCACKPVADGLGEAMTLDFWKAQINGVEERTQHQTTELRRLQKKYALLEKEECDVDRQIELMKRRRYKGPEVSARNKEQPVPTVAGTTSTPSMPQSYYSPLGSKHYFCCIVLKVRCDVPQSTVYVTYATYEASWRCQYEIDLDSQKSAITLHCNAVVKGGVENFEDVALTLSSAVPRENNEKMTKLKPWRLKIAGSEAACSTASDGGRGPRPSEPVGSCRSRSSSSSSSSSGDEGVDLPDKPWNVHGYAEGIGPVVNFSLPGRYTLRAITHSATDTSTDLRVPITTRRWKAKVSYIVVPSLSEVAYALATCTNKTPDDDLRGALPILPGWATVMLDGNFVTNTSLQRTAPGETLQFCFGVDPSIEVKRQFLWEKCKGARGFSGLVGCGSNAKSRTVYSYITTLVNNKPGEAVLVTLRERIPKSNSTDLVVELIEPADYAVGDIEKRRNLETDGRVDIQVALNPGESRAVHFSFAVVAPHKAKIHGL